MKTTLKIYVWFIDKVPPKRLHLGESDRAVTGDV
jgi:hypothetical protein